METGAVSEAGRLRGWHVQNGSWARQAAVAAAEAGGGAKRRRRPEQLERRPGVPMNHFVRVTTPSDAHLRSQSQFPQNLILLSQKKQFTQPKQIYSANGNPFMPMI